MQTCQTINIPTSREKLGVIVYVTGWRMRACFIPARCELLSYTSNLHSGTKNELHRPKPRLPQPYQEIILTHILLHSSTYINLYCKL